MTNKLKLQFSLSAMIILFIAVFISSCNDVEGDMLTKNDLTNTQETDMLGFSESPPTFSQDLDQIGNYHNAALRHFIDQDPFETTSPYDQLAILKNSNEHVLQTTIDEREMQKVISDFDQGNMQDPTGLLNTYLELVRPHVSQEEFDFLVNAQSIFVSLNDANLSVLEQFNSIIELSSNKIIEFENNFNVSNNKGEIAGGFLYIANASAHFWKSQYELEEQDKSKSDISSSRGTPWWKKIRGTGVRADAIGYIIGWGDALIDDYNNGGINPDGQWKRIRKGGVNAINWSGGWLIGL